MGNQYSLTNLYDAIERFRHTPFAWGEHDCALFAANVLLAYTGEDFATVFRGRYKSKSGAYRVLKPYGGLSGYITSIFKPKPIKMAQRGDLVMKDNCVGICLGRVSAFVYEVNGLVFLPTLTMDKAWQT
jgi:hypothetical protein